MQHKAYPSGKFAKRQPMQRKENLPYRGKNISVSWCPSKEKAGDLIKDFLLGGAAGGSWHSVVKVRVNVPRRWNGVIKEPLSIQPISNDFIFFKIQFNDMVRKNTFSKTDSCSKIVWCYKGYAGIINLNILKPICR